MDKPPRITSHDVVDRVRKIFSTRRVGHTGTLDPQATGLLVILLGEATKISEYLMGTDKSYEGTIKFGVVSDTYDAEGNVTPGPGGPIPTDLEAIQELAGELTGEQMQVPPIYSAKKVKGKKLYEYARSGETPEIEPRKVRIDDFELLNMNGDQVEFGVDCSAGTYVRSLAHDLGQKAGCGAILTELRRTDVGSFGIEDSHTLDELEAMEGPAALAKALMPIRRALSAFPTLYLMAGAERWIRNGQAIPHNMVHSDDDARPRRNAQVLLCRLNGEAVAVARVDPAPMSPPPKAMAGGAPPWYQPIKQFEVAERPDHADDDEAGNA